MVFNCRRNAYNMVLHKYGEMLYNGLKQTVEDHLKDIATGVVGANDDNFLQDLNKAWNDHKISMLMIRDILMYMVSSFLLLLFFASQDLLTIK